MIVGFIFSPYDKPIKLLLFLKPPFSNCMMRYFLFLVRLVDQNSPENNYLRNLSIGLKSDECEIIAWQLQLYKITLPI